jgi:transcriptional regulator with AAA-type ATPase domain
MINLLFKTNISISESALQKLEEYRFPGNVRELQYIIERVIIMLDGNELTPDEIIFGYGVPLLTNAGATDKSARSFLGSLRKAHGDETLVNTLRDCLRAKPLQPLEWLAKALPPDGIKPKLNKQESLEASNRAVVEKLLKKEGFV